MVTWWGIPRALEGEWAISLLFPNSCVLLVAWWLLALLGGLLGRKLCCSLNMTREQWVLKAISVFPIRYCGDGKKRPYGACLVSYHPSQELVPFNQTYTRALRVLSVRIGRAGVEVSSHYKRGKLRLKGVGRKRLFILCPLCCRH